MRAKELMTEEVVTIGPEQLARDAARKFELHHISGLPVVDAGGRVLGFVSESDISGSGQDRPVGELMSSPTVTVEEDAPAEELAVIIRSHNINHLPVLRQGRLVGIVTRDDLLSYLANLNAWKENL